MGGFYYYRDGEPTYPSDFEDVRTLVQSRSLVPPTAAEVGDRSKGDTLSKTVAVVQTFWFIAQCIARRAQGMTITNLEIMTLAYTMITVAMYAAWWHKPLNVRCPVRVKGDLQRRERVRSFKWTKAIDYVIGEQDYTTRLDQHDRVPTFWSSSDSLNGNIPLYADIIALLVAMVFGAVHCAAWSYTFPSIAERVWWRTSAIAITAIPILMAAAFAAFDPFFPPDTFDNLFDYFPFVCMGLSGLLYILARIVLLSLSFTTLRDLPPSALHTVQWTNFVPHI